MKISKYVLSVVVVALFSLSSSVTGYASHLDAEKTDHVYVCDLNELDAVIIDPSEPKIVFTDFLFYIDQELESYIESDSVIDTVYDWYDDADVDETHKNLVIDKVNLTALYRIIESSSDKILETHELPCSKMKKDAVK